MHQRILRLTGFFLLSVPLLADAQATSAVRPADPVPGAARAEEAWSPAPAGSELLRRLKHISLVRTDRAWLTLGGSLRLRGSDTRNYLFSPAAASQDDFTEMRTLLSTDLWVGSRERWHARGFAEWRDAQGFGRTLPGGVRSNEADRSDWQSHFVEIGFAKNGLRLGRQDVALGRERLVGYSDWSNSRRSFEGARLLGTSGRFQWDAFRGWVVNVRTNEPNRGDTLTRLTFGALTSTSRRSPGDAWRLASAQLYAIVAEVEFVPSTRRTLGGRFTWDRRGAARDWTGEFEGAFQGGHFGDREVRAWFGVGEGTVTWREARFSPSATAGVEIATGMGSDAAIRVRTFVPSYATSHSHNGIADVFGRTNLRELRVGAGARPYRSVQLLALGRKFDRVSLADGAYTKTGGLLRGAGGSPGRALGQELDLTAQWSTSPRFRVLGGAAWMSAGEFIRNTGTAAPVRWAFLSTVLAF